MNKLFIAISIATAFLLGCNNPEKTLAIPHGAESLKNLSIGRTYMAEGRYELAKEYFLLALAAANNEEIKSIAIQEVTAVDLMIKTQR